MRVDVRDAPAAARFEARLEGEPAGFLEYRVEEGRLLLLHTEVDPAHGGKGVGTELARHALGEARTRKLQVVPWCPFVRSFISRNPEWVDLVPWVDRERFGL